MNKVEIFSVLFWAFIIGGLVYIFGAVPTFFILFALIVSFFMFVV